MSNSDSKSASHDSFVYHEDDEYSESSVMSHKECIVIEGDIGFKPNPSNNYYCNIFHKDTCSRTAMFDGAVSLDEFMPNALDFFRHYAQFGNPTTIYYMSAILTNKTFQNIIILEGKLFPRQRLFAIKQCLEKFYKVFDILFKVFIKDGNKKFYKYRDDTPFDNLIKAYELYLQMKKQLDELIAPVANETEETIKRQVSSKK